MSQNIKSENAKNNKKNRRHYTFEITNKESKITR